MDGVRRCCSPTACSTRAGCGTRRSRRCAVSFVASSTTIAGRARASRRRAVWTWTRWRWTPRRSSRRWASAGIRRSLDGWLRGDASRGATPELLRSLALLDTSAGAEPPEPASVGWSGSRGGSGRGRSWVRCRPSCTGRARGGPGAEGGPAHLARASAAARRSRSPGGGGVLQREPVLALLGQIGVPRWCSSARRTPRPCPPVPGDRRGDHRARLAQIPRAGHMSAIDAPEAVTAELRAFLASVE